MKSTLIETQLYFKLASKINNLEESFMMPFDDKVVQELGAYKKAVKDEKMRITGKDEEKGI